MTGGGVRVSAGNIANAICLRCGLEFRYRQLRVEADTSLFVCNDCLDEPDPRRRMLPRSDALALERASPDRELTNPPNGPPPDPYVWGDNDDPDGWFQDPNN